MDLHFGHDEPTAAEREAIDRVLGPPDSRWDGGDRLTEADGRGALGGASAREGRDRLLPALHAANARAGFISRGALSYISRRLTVPLAEAYGVATFYSLFSVGAQRPAAMAHLCDDIACRLKGAEDLCKAVEATLGAAGWSRSPCLGLCESAPAALVVRSGESPSESLLGGATPQRVLAALAGGDAGRAGRARAPLPQRGEPGLRLLRRIGRVDPESLDDYRAHGGYGALRAALALGPAGVIREVTESKLMGRGGAAFPTGRKWEAVSKAVVRPHYVVCNADESEPGTFKDRVLMEEDPFAIVEAMTIAGFATGSERGYLYVRGEYPLAAERLSHAIASARARGLLGESILGHPFRFDIELRRGAGAYICGEETALFNSIEGYRGEPRNKPPFPVEAGLFGKPTAINNVETLVNVLEIVTEGGPAFAGQGTTGSSGTKLFCLSGHVARPGLYEVPFGTRLGELVAMAGGVAGSGRLAAILLGGAAGSFVLPGELEMPLTFEGTRAAGASLGSGVVMLFDDTVDLAGTLLRIARFFREESCGQCVPCRVGTVRQEELLERLSKGRYLGSEPQERALLSEIAQAMRDASICGLGQTAASAIQSALQKLPLAGGTGR